MQIKISVSTLEIGMYVSKLDKPWLDSGFLFQGFLIEDNETIEQIKRQCEHVFINIEQSIHPKKIIEKSLQAENIERASTTIETSKESEALQKDKRKNEYREFSHADVIYNDAYHLIKEMTDDVQSERPVNVNNIRAITQKLIASILRNSDALIWFSKLKQKDTYAYRHAINVAIYSIAFSKMMSFSDEDTLYLGMVGLLQDIGKAKMPNDLLDRPKALTSAEVVLCHAHVQHSVNILSSYACVPDQVLEAISNHHERLSGNGYPRGLRGSEIDKLATISGLVDCYDAMTNERPYATARSSYAALAELRKLRDKDFPSILVDKFIQFVGIYAVGNIVELNTGEIGIIVKQNYEQRLKPHVQLILDPQQNKYSKNPIIDLAESPMNKFGEAYNISKVLSSTDVTIDVSRYMQGLH